MSVDWAHIGRERFDQIVEALFDRLYGDADEFQVYDGRGGDGGRDIYVRQGKRVRIFQLKHFPEGFSSENRKRRNQIKKSFETAMEHKPQDWTLVVPRNLTSGELDFIAKLSGDREVKVGSMGRAQLDSRLSAHPDIVNYFLRDDLLEKAKVYNLEKDLLLGGVADLTERIRNLGNVGEDLNPDWRVNFARSGDTVIHVLEAKHPRAQEKSPIGIKIETVFGAGDKDLEEKFKQVLGFGVRERLHLPPEVVSSLEVSGPQFIEHSSTNVDVFFQPTSGGGEPALIEMRFRDENDVLLSSHTGTATEAGEAHLGRSLRAQFYKGMTLLWLMPHDKDAEGTIKSSLTIENLDPQSVLRVLDLKDAIGSAHAIEVRLGGADWMKIKVEPSIWPEHDAENGFEWLRLLADDLDVVQKHCQVYFPIPEEVTPLERIELRCARLLLDGHCVVVPGTKILYGRLNGQIGHGLRELLEGKPARMIKESPDFGFDLFGHTLTLGSARIFNTNTEILGAAEALAALDAGTAEGLRIEMAPKGTSSYWTFMPERWTGDYETSVVLTPWGIDGIDESPDIRVSKGFAAAELDPHNGDEGTAEAGV